MLINTLIEKVQNSKFSKFLSDSLIFEYIDDIAFFLLIAVIVSTSFMPTGAIGILACFFVMACVFKMFIKKGEAAELSFLNKVLILYLLFVIISAVGASYLKLSLFGTIKTLIYISFYFASVYFLSTNKKRIIPTILTIAIVTSFEAFIGILQNISHVQEIATWQDTSNIDPTHAISRAYGTIKPYNPNLLAGYLIAGISSIFTFLGISYFNKHKQGLIISSVLFLIVMYAIFVTGCRGAYLGLFGILAVIFIYSLYFMKKYFGGFSQIKKRYKLIIASTFVFLAGVICLVPSFLNRVISIFSFRKDSSISFRMNVYEACYQMFLDNKFLGIGVGNKNFREIYGLYMKTGFDALGSYSVPLEIAVESGIFALISFGAFIVLIVTRAIRYTIKPTISPINRTIVFSILLMITGVMFHGLFDTIFFRPQIQIIFWTNIAIFHALTIRREKLKKLRLLK